MQRANVRNGELRDRARLAFEALAELGIVGEVGRQHLDCDDAVEARVSRLVDFARASRTQGRQNFVRPQTHAGV